MGCSILAAVLVALVVAPGAAATTVVSGEDDANAPLVIDPSTAPTDPLARPLAAHGGVHVMYIQDMPVTKTVTGVTLGDLARAENCGSDAVLRLYVREHPEGDFQSSEQIAYSDDTPTVGATPGRVSWTIPARSLRAGRGYSFRISPVSGCTEVEQTTWAHNEDQVNSGPATCTGGPSHKRMWHVQGADDAPAGCVSRGEPYRKFKPDMPTGWLVSRWAGTSYDIATAQHEAGDPNYNACNLNGLAPSALGGEEAYWRQVAPAYPEWVCRWTQFAPPDAPVFDGWYYAQPWRTEHDGAPRDMYLRLDTIAYEVSLLAHVPILRYDGDEDFHALSPAAATDFFDASDDPDDPEDSNQLEDSSGTFATANPMVSFGEDILSLDYLGSGYFGSGRRASTLAEPADFISLRGNSEGGIFSSDGYDDDAAQMEAIPGYANRVYGRVAHGGDGRLWLQYWLYYYFDDQVNTIYQGAHEGDWEMVQVGLDLATSTTPALAAYSQHDGGERCDWATQVTSVNGQPVVYVADASHASYVRADHYDEPDPDDDADGQGLEETPTLEQIRSDAPGWVAWPGSWGDSGEASPPGPQFQGEKWSDPSDWAGDLAPCDAS